MWYTKNYQILCRKSISMLTGLKVSSLAFKSVFYRPEHNLKIGTHGIEFSKPWNAEMKHTNQKSQRLDEKNGVICLVIKFTARFLVIKMSKKNHFFIICWLQQTIHHSFGKNIKFIWNILFRAFSTCNGLLCSELRLARFQPLKIQDFGIFLYFYPRYLTNSKAC